MPFDERGPWPGPFDDSRSDLVNMEESELEEDDVAPRSVPSASLPLRGGPDGLGRLILGLGLVVAVAIGALLVLAIVVAIATAVASITR